tara:strand:+ start:2782 stop:3183 length:402 start_codon:yes stop_codon:yes gene_type:complete
VKRLLQSLAALVIMAVTWLLIPPELFLKPTSVSIEGYQVTVARRFPLAWLAGQPFVAYVEVVQSLDTGRTCADNNARGFRYPAEEKGIGTWDIESWASPCMTATFHWSASWYVKALGVIPLRPVVLSKTFSSE